MTSEFKPAPIAPAVQIVDGREVMIDGKGNPVPVSNVRPSDKLIDDTVRTIFGFALALSEQLARFKGHTMDDIMETVDLLGEEYGVRLGGKKGNTTLTSFDGLMKVELRIADLIEFGPELLAAKELIDECLNEWSADAGDELRAVVTRAFNTDKAGQVNRAELFALRRLEIADERWKNAMRALTDAIRVVGSKEYIRFQRRADIGKPWESVTIDLAKA